ncbi:hypothetical protein PF010_g26112 [Phytophthora fragariae]|uniref:Uncharacterized protein n=1 Tax=Phytophthora fragariae TaxID=53985 RepID=A0A6G0JXR6_9STRA|nr:hypothetical protein PF010_g26112 [Phytophthora fragariae]KAE9178013.1 hypothetical protein PF004_g25614 [Phytophthora fragariae]
MAPRRRLILVRRVGVVFVPVLMRTLPPRGSGGVEQPRTVLCSARDPAGDCAIPGDP